MEINREKESESENERKKGRIKFKSEWSDYSLSELKEILKFKGLPITGLKEDLIRRLQADQQYQSQTIKKSNAILSEKERKQTTDITAAIRYSTNISIIQREIELYRKEAMLNRKEAILNRKEKELVERELALIKKELEKIQQVQVNTDVRTQEKSRYFHKPLEDRHSDDDVSVKRNKDTKRTEREREQPKTPSCCFNYGQRDYSEANCRIKYKDAKYHFKNSGHIAAECNKKNEERRNTYAREKSENDRYDPIRRIKTATRYLRST